VLEAKIPETGHIVTQHPKDDVGAGATIKTQNGAVKSGQQAFEEGQSHAQGMKEQAGGVADDLQQ
jgi:hypothetical protein